MNSKIYAIMRKEMLHILRDPRSLFMAIGMPMIFIVLFGYAINMDIDNVIKRLRAESTSPVLPPAATLK